jgi:hypothetical protein
MSPLARRPRQAGAFRGAELSYAALTGESAIDRRELALRFFGERLGALRRPAGPAP